MPLPQEVGHSSSRYPEHAFTYVLILYIWTRFSYSLLSQHRQGWFTYSYCHNKEIRQFRELAQSVSRLPGTFILCYPLNYSRSKFDTDSPPPLIPFFSVVYHSFSAFRALQSIFLRVQSSGRFTLALIELYSRRQILSSQLTGLSFMKCYH